MAATVGLLRAASRANRSGTLGSVSGRPCSSRPTTRWRSPPAEKAPQSQPLSTMARNQSSASYSSIALTSASSGLVVLGGSATPLDAPHFPPPPPPLPATNPLVPPTTTPPPPATPPPPPPP